MEVRGEDGVDGMGKGGRQLQGVENGCQWEGVAGAGSSGGVMENATWWLKKDLPKFW